MANERILVVDDDEHIVKALGMFLRHEGMQVEGAHTGSAGVEAANRERFDLILLDLDLPDIDGFAVLERLRSAGDTTPVIIVSGHDEEYNKLVGLGSGADDYITKPFSMPLLLSKARALIRRSSVYSARDGGEGTSGDAATGNATAGGGSVLRCGPFELDRSSYRLSKNGRPVDLTARELALATLFLEHPGRVFSKAQIYEAVWQNPVIDENTVMVYVKRLRDKLEDDPSKPCFLQTLRGIGYKFVV